MFINAMHSAATMERGAIVRGSAPDWLGPAADCL